MALSTIYPNGVIEIDIPATQSIAVSNYGGGIASIYYLVENANRPSAYKLQQTLENAGVVLGAFAAGQKLKIEAGSSTVIFDVGSSPDTGIGDADTLNGMASDTGDTADTIAARDGSGDITANAFESTVATGTAPFSVASTTVVTNLNADTVDGVQGSNIAKLDEANDFETGITVADIEVVKGIDWTSRTSAADNNWFDVTYGNGLFVAVAYTGSGNRVMTSPDGVNWTSRTSAADNNWLSVTYGNGLFVAVSDTGTGNRVMTSPDGITWTSRTSAADNEWLSVTYGNGLFVAVSETGSGDRVMSSGVVDLMEEACPDHIHTSIAGNTIYHGGNLGAGANGTLQLPSLASDPASGEAAGQIYYNTTSNVIRFYNDSAWGNV
jgi:hypothetical protein